MKITILKKRLKALSVLTLQCFVDGCWLRGCPCYGTARGLKQGPMQLDIRCACLWAALLAGGKQYGRERTNELQRFFYGLQGEEMFQEASITSQSIYYMSYSLYKSPGNELYIGVHLLTG